MDRSREQDNFETPIHKFLTWIDKTCSYEIIDPDSQQPRRQFKVIDEIKDRLSEGNKSILFAIAARLSSHEENLWPDDVLPDNVAVFCTLLKISRGKRMKYFSHHDSLRDDKLPFDPSSPPPYWPQNIGDPDFLTDFCKQQWQFCVPFMRRPFVDKHFDKDRILPIVYKEHLPSPGTTDLWRVKLHPHYNQLIKEEEKEILRKNDLADTYFLKQYLTSNAENNYNKEVEAFRHVEHCPNIIGFRGSYIRGDTYNVLLEYADKGSLEEYFQEQLPPRRGEDIICFWEGLFKLIDGLRAIHGQVPESNSAGFQGWHQDVKPANILLVSNGSDNPYKWRFKLADLGLSHFRRGTGGTAMSSASQGTRTYGAPEIYRGNDISQDRPVKVEQKCDIFSLGCIFSEAARWLAEQHEGIKRYRKEREEELVRKRPGFRDPDCFHDGMSALDSVRKSNTTSGSDLRKQDFITKQVIDKMIEEMLFPEQSRPEAQVLWEKSVQIINDAKRALEEAKPPQELKPPRRARTAPIKPQTPPFTPPGHPTALRASPQQPGLFMGEVVPEEYDEEEDDDNDDHINSPAVHGGLTYGTGNKRNRHAGHSMLMKGATFPRSYELPARFSNPDNSPLNGEKLVNNPFQSVSHGHSAQDSTNSLGGRRTNGWKSGDIDQIHDDDQGRGFPVESHSHDVATSNYRSRYDYNPQEESSNGGFIDRAPPLRKFKNHSLDYKRNDSCLPDVTSITHDPFPESISTAPFSGNQTLQPPKKPSVPTRNPSDVPFMSVEDVLKWKAARQGGRSRKQRIANHEYQDRLNNRDHVFLIDDSKGMKLHWQDVCKTFEALSYIVKSTDPNGIDLYFTNSQQVKKNCKETSHLLNLVRTRTCRTRSDIQHKLKFIFDEYKIALDRPEQARRFSIMNRKSPIRPLSLYVLTDGAWENDCDLLIKNLLDKLIALGHDGLQVGIQFIRFGNDPEGKRRLKRLDEDLGVVVKDEVIDIVDTVKHTGNVWKMLLGATHKDLDHDDEVDDEEEDDSTPQNSINTNRTPIARPDG